MSIVRAGNIEFDFGFKPALGTWTHVVVTRSGSVITSYMNGQQFAQNISFAPAAYTANTTVTLGKSTDVTYTEPSNCLMDEVGIWNRSINLQEINYLYNSGLGKQYPF
jgi:hypothetical protein